MCRSSCFFIVCINLHNLILFGSVYYYYYYFFFKTRLLFLGKDSATLRVEIKRSKDPENGATSIIFAQDSKFLFFFNFFFFSINNNNVRNLEHIESVRIWYLKERAGIFSLSFFLILFFSFFLFRRLVDTFIG